MQYDLDSQLYYYVQFIRPIDMNDVLETIKEKRRAILKLVA